MTRLGDDSLGDSLVLQSMLHSSPASIYGQEAFRHLLWVERKRAAQAGRSPLLLLVSLSNSKSSDRVLSPLVSSTLFTGLQACLREVDFLGWYEEPLTVGAVLAQRNDPPADVAALIAERVSGFLSHSVSPRVAERLRVRVIRVGSELDAYV